MQVKELIKELQQFDPDAEIIGTWEGTVEPIEVYRAADGRIMIDVDNGAYKIRWQGLKCEVCGKPAVHAPFKAAKPVCYKHWYAFVNKEEALKFKSYGRPGYLKFLETGEC